MLALKYECVSANSTNNLMSSSINFTFWHKNWDKEASLSWKKQQSLNVLEVHPRGPYQTPAKAVLAHYHFSYTEADGHNPHTCGKMSRNSPITEISTSSDNIRFSNIKSWGRSQIFRCEVITSISCWVMSVQDVKTAKPLLLANIVIYI